MLTEYEEKRLEYNLAVNDLNRYKNDYETKRIEVTKRKFNSLVKEKEQKITELKDILDNFFADHQEEIVISMLKEYLNISSEYEFYNDEVLKDENGKYFIEKKTKDIILNEIDSLRNKIQKRYDDKVITSIIYNDLNRCLDLYQEKILNKWSSLSKKKFVEVEEAKVIAKNNKTNKKKKTDENWLFVRVMLPIIIIDIICALFILFMGAECSVGSSEALSIALCTFMVFSHMVVIFVTPIVVIYLLVRSVKFLKNRKKK